jgi:hypothetical protein
MCVSAPNIAREGDTSTYTLLYRDGLEELLAPLLGACTATYQSKSKGLEN